MKVAASLFCVAMAIPSTTTAQTIIVRAARMLDVTNGQMVPNPSVLVEAGRITAIHAARQTAAEVIDLGDMTLLPGFIDAHVHLGLDDAYSPAGRYSILTENTADATLRQARNAQLILLSGFTTIREVGQLHPSLDLISVALGRASEREWIVAPHVVAAGHALSITGGHIDPSMFVGTAEGILELDARHGVANGIDGVVAATRYQIKHGAKVIKVAATAGVMTLEAALGAQQYSEAEIRAVVEEANRHGIPVAAHAHGIEGIKASVRAGVASVEHGSFLDDEAVRMMKERGTYLVPTVALASLIPLDKLPPLIRAKAETALPQLDKSVRLAVREGVKIALGTDAPFVPHGQNAKEFSALVAHGMTPIDAIRAGTVNAAELLRVPDRGRIAPGLLADLVAVRGNPLDEIDVLQRVEFVMKAGRIYKRP